MGVAIDQVVALSPLWFTSSSHTLGPPFIRVVEAASPITPGEAAEHPVVRRLHEVGLTAGTANEASIRDAGRR